MSISAIIQVAIELWSVLILLLCAFAAFLERKNDPRRATSIGVLMLFVVILLISDSAAYILRGSPSALSYYGVRISNFLVFWMTVAITYGAAEYIFSCVDTKNRTVRIVRHILFLLAVLYTGFLIVSQIYGLAYSFDEMNLYHRGDYYYVCAAFGFIMIGLLLFLTIHFRAALSQYEMISICTYMLLPLITDVIQIFYYGLSLNNLAVTIGVLLLAVTYCVESSRQSAERNAILMKQRAKIAEQKNQIAVSQIQPHFIFNVLGSIEQLCRVDASKAEIATHKFAYYLRSNLNTMRKNPQTGFEEELKLIESYVWLEKMRFGDDLQFEADTPCVDFQLPLMSIQPLVENAVKHGMRDDEGAVLHISLRTTETPEAVIITVSDDGVGFDPSHVQTDGRLHVGLENVCSRIADVNHGKVTIDSTVGTGTVITVTLPKVLAEV